MPRPLSQAHLKHQLQVQGWTSHPEVPHIGDNMSVTLKDLWILNMIVIAELGFIIGFIVTKL
jgi:hypothetical protein